MRKIKYTLLFILLISAFIGHSQQILLLEKINSAQTEKIYEGSYLQYQVAEDDSWYGGEIVELREDIQALIFTDRIVSLDRIVRLRQRRSWPFNLGYSLATFGTAWSGFALIGTATDGDPDTRYRGSDAIVSGVSIGTGLLVAAVFGNKKIRVGDGRKRRLRIIDVSF